MILLEQVGGFGDLGEAVWGESGSGVSVEETPVASASIVISGSAVGGPVETIASALGMTGEEVKGLVWGP